MLKIAKTKLKKILGFVKSISLCHVIVVRGVDVLYVVDLEKF